MIQRSTRYTELGLTNIPNAPPSMRCYRWYSPVQRTPPHRMADCGWLHQNWAQKPTQLLDLVSVSVVPIDFWVLRETKFLLDDPLVVERPCWEWAGIHSRHPLT